MENPIRKQYGAIVDGVPAGILIDQDLITSDLMKRQPGAIGTTPRKEKMSLRFSLECSTDMRQDLLFTS